VLPTSSSGKAFGAYRESGSRKATQNSFQAEVAPVLLEVAHDRRLCGDGSPRRLFTLRDRHHRCGSYARCTTCRIEYLEGEPEKMTKAELEVLQSRALLGQVRLSCQALCDHD
jgi:hypothetical protein